MGHSQNVTTEIMRTQQTVEGDARVTPSALLAKKISAVRRKYVGVAAGTGAGMAVGAFIILLSVAMLLDWWLDFPLWARGLMLAWVTGTTGFIIWRFVITPI